MKPNIPGSVGARRASTKLNPLEGVVDDVMGAFSGAKKGLKNPLDGAVDDVKGLFSSNKKGLNNQLNGAVDDVLGAFSGSKKGLNLLSPNKSNRNKNRLAS